MLEDRYRVARSPVSVPGETDAAHIEHRLLVGQREDVIALLRRDELVGHREHARDVRVALEAVLGNPVKQRVHLALVVNVLREDVFVRRLSRRTMDESKIAFGSRARQLAEEIPALIGLSWIAASVLKLISRPIDGLQSNRVEAVGVKQRRLIVIAQDRQLAATNDRVEALARIRAIADNVAQAVDLGDPPLADVVQHRSQRGIVAMDVADEGSLHEAMPCYRLRGFPIVRVPSLAWGAIRSLEYRLKYKRNLNNGSLGFPRHAVK